MEEKAAKGVLDEEEQRAAAGEARTSCTEMDVLMAAKITWW